MTLDLSASSIELTRVICDIESVSGNETALADAIEQALAGFDHLEIIRDGDTVVARTNLGRAQRVVIAGHIDTVPLNRNLPTRFETIDGVDYLWGRGTVDMKAGVAVQLKLAAELTEPVVDVTWMWYDHEEVADDLNGLGRLARNRPDLFEGDFAILGEPTNSRIEGGCNGNVRVEIRTFGLRAHSARSWVGDNAIHKVGPILEILAGYQAREVEVEGLVYREGLNAVGISGGIAGNVIPDECMVHVNYRFAPSRTSAEAVMHLEDLFQGYEITIVDRAEGAHPGLDAVLAREFMAAVGGEARPKYGWTDVARFSALGVPAVNYGPGDPLKAHADDERVALQQITECEDGLRSWLSAPVG
ncbi:succinyl-diaminopimelate desuccinylase [Cryobacterium sp. TMT1-21]|uniref:Succinyl-diaminopimelate desuccinylase n=1 Tax=Cryobacterium shii TaxID=1259235 RepID=A0AAQ2HG99_9MICO|nr:succinyl-diaminopimelate desuccinylase [Cryobacterium sp. TMT4-10]TFC51328.1 succinyl-diaminopimelate desuccinylase [Cryobacterium shii]TFC85271.1 succinyl-diaminopimelate desuccinylase [Cryobacterium sp. TmT2-59]TFD17125.1 succinyl-diaminopimelate desuccinylase [Cryobacterium sp. TMT1-21]TFD18187.1 succinyl-diaminopimelate desuccinylase [Cryobacterium sp. TMT2-23]TFD41450.1 succinyl-diaminopimelate desuccinylase [Cryobacterium sp. TMT2-10]